uniref:Uncharacterized protein n=1 Tax=Rangifer tarandus platyrhynchus TaxID=3082113 RepID=A0ACB0E4B0_RANTA|nr:unnamed protein product [Rangifer tarandus platyrhynchus]
MKPTAAEHATEGGTGSNPSTPDGAACSRAGVGLSARARARDKTFSSGRSPLRSGSGRAPGAPQRASKRLFGAAMKTREDWSCEKAGKVPFDKL